MEICVKCYQMRVLKNGILCKLLKGMCPFVDNVIDGKMMQIESCEYALERFFKRKGWNHA